MMGFDDFSFFLLVYYSYFFFFFVFMSIIPFSNTILSRCLQKSLSFSLFHHFLFPLWVHLLQQFFLILLLYPAWDSKSFGHFFLRIGIHNFLVFTYYVGV